MITAVVFDFGGVMTTTTMPERVREIVARLGIDWSVIESGFKKYRNRMDGDFMTLREMYAKIWSDAGITLDAETQEQILKADTASYLYRNERTLDWMRSLKARGLKLGILTNMNSRFAVLFREHFADFIALADALVISGEVHLFKPQPEIYLELQSRLQVPANEICFVDDVGTNCKGACAAGWQAIRFESNAQAEAELEARLGA